MVASVSPFFISVALFQSVPVSPQAVQPQLFRPNHSVLVLLWEYEQQNLDAAGLGGESRCEH